MAKDSRVALLSTLLLGGILGGAIVLHSQANNTAALDRLASQSANLSKMDVLLMNAKVGALESILFSNLSVPLVPNEYKYDDKQRKIQIRVAVNPMWLSRNNIENVKTELNDSVSSVCNSTILGGTSETMLQLGSVGWKQYCAVKFWTVSAETRPAPKDVATYENGELVLK